MGLTIHYSLRSTTRSGEEARGLVEQLRQRALELPFERVGEIIDLSGDDCDFGKAVDGGHRWLLVQASRSVERGDRIYSVPPIRLIAFPTLPGKGSESANFGLCRYPRTIPDPSERGAKQIRTGVSSGWFWSSFCKTQYASNPSAGSVENFLRCHLSVVRLLDYAAELDILHEVHDEGEYWDRRDVEALAKTVGQWNAMMAGFVGGIKDLLGGHDVQSEITKFPNFEHLEAEGRADAAEDGDD